MAAVTRRQYKGAAAATTTTNALSVSDTSVTLTATTGFPSAAGVPFFVVIDPGTSSEEKCSATISGSTLTLVRAQDDTTAAVHASGATIYPVFTADEADEANLLASTLTTRGDLLTMAAGPNFGRIAIGATGTVLKSDGTDASWATIAAANIASNAVETAKINDNAVTTAKIQDGAVTGVKQANFAVSTKTSSYTLVAADRHTRIEMNSTSSTTITVNTSLFAAGDIVELLNINTGVTTVTAGTATVSSAGPLAIPQYGGGTLYFTSANAAIFFPSAGPAASSGLTFISSTAVTGSQVNITNCFSATYESYLIIGRNITGPGDSFAFDFRLGVSGTPNTANDYFSGAVETSYGAGNYVEIGQCGTGDVNNFQMEITAPQLVQQTFFTYSWQGLYLTGVPRMRNGYHQSTTQFTDFVLLVRSGASDFTQGNIKIYGYAAS